MKSVVVALLLTLSLAVMPAYALTVVPATADLWLAGMPDGTQDTHGDSAPAQSPALADGLSLAAGAVLTFNPTGAVTYGYNVDYYGPEGRIVQIETHTPLENGLSRLYAPIASLVGVFLNDNQPSGTAPTTLDFTDQAARDYLSLAPALQQTFFIGDGQTSGSTVQQITVPTGATRLFLGVMDGAEWNNNAGSFSVEISGNPVPLPGALWLLGAGLLGLAGVRARRRKP